MYYLVTVYLRVLGRAKPKALATGLSIITQSNDEVMLGARGPVWSRATFDFMLDAWREMRGAENHAQVVIGFAARTTWVIGAG